MVCSSFRTKFYEINFLLVFLLLAYIVFNASTVVAAVAKESGKSTVDSIQKTVGSPNNLPTAVLWYLEKANDGDAEAQYDLGNVYEMGFGVEVSYELAAKWYKDAAEQDHQMAQLKLGILYILGKGVRESTLKGGKWIRAAARQGNSVAKTLQNRVLSHNVQQDFNVKILVDSVRIALEKGETNAEETIKLALQKIDRIGKDAPKDSRFVKGVTGSGAKKGSVGNRIPSFLDKESVQNVEVDKSISLVKRLAKEGDAEAQYELARFYEIGDQLERSRNEAFKWYIAAANQGHAAAQYHVGLAYLYAYGTEQNIGTARKWLNKAKLANDPNATLLLQHMPLATSTGINKSIALSWYLDRSLMGDGEAMLALGNMYENGWGVNQDVDEAKKWYIKARVTGTKGASIQLRRMKLGTGEAANEEPIEEQAPEPPTALNLPAIADSQPAKESLNNLQAKNTAKPLRQAREKNTLISKESQNFKEKQENLGAFASIKSVFSKLIKSAGNARDAMVDKARENATPLVLAFLGIIMGALVFRWMRKEETDESSMFE